MRLNVNQIRARISIDAWRASLYILSVFKGFCRLKLPRLLAAGAKGYRNNLIQRMTKDHLSTHIHAVEELASMYVMFPPGFFRRGGGAALSSVA